MKNLFSIENPFMEILSKFADMMFINILTLFCCFPLITIGAAITANHKVMQNLVMKEEKPLFCSYFHSFRINFKQSTIVWLFLLFFLFSFSCSVALIAGRFDGTFATILYVCIAVMAVLIFSVSSYMFPLIARYENSLREHLHNSIWLAIAKMHKTLLMLVLNALPLIILLISTRLFMDSLVIWMLVGVSLLIYASNCLLKPVFAELESRQEVPAEEAEAEAEADEDADEGKEDSEESIPDSE